jgi:YVTN family beta-propeller protein
MNPPSWRRHLRLISVVTLCVAACGKLNVLPPTATSAPQPTSAPVTAPTLAPAATASAATRAPSAVAKNPSYSSSIAISDDDSLLVVANPLDGSISVFNVAADANKKLGEVKTGDQPATVALTSDQRYAYVTNFGSATVSVVDLAGLKKVQDIAVGSGPYGVALTPDGALAFVADSAGNDVAVIDTASNTVSKVILIPGVQPRGLAITNNNGGQGPQKVLVTQFLSQPTATGGPGQDQGSEGKVFVISTDDLSKVQGTITLAAHDTAFAADRTAFGGTDKDPTFAYPNQLQSVVIKDGWAYLPNVAASPEGPVKFNVDTQAFLSAIDLASQKELPGGTINLQAAVKAQTSPNKLFFANPWAVAFKHSAAEGYVVSEASDVLVKVALDGSGVPSAGSVPADNDTNRVLSIPVGQTPRGIVINNADTRAYVMNYLSKDVSVVDLSQQPEAEMARLQSANLPADGTDAAKFLIGNYLFNTSVGKFDEGVTGRMSSQGWQSCASCHPDGLSDGVVWAFASGPRRTIPLNGTFSPADPAHNQRVLNDSAIFDEIEDFELNIRGTSGGAGLIVKDGSTDADPNVKAFDPPSAGRTQLHVHGVGGWDAIAAWVAHRVVSPQSAFARVDATSTLGQQIAQGRALFTQSNCQLCHGGPKWSTGQVDFARVSPFPETLTPGVAPEPTNAQLARFLKPVGTFDPNNPLEKTAANQAALGKLGYNPPSLLSTFAFPPYFHNGSCPDLLCVLQNDTHFQAGGKALLSDPSQRQALFAFLLSIDGKTEPINP